MSLNTQYSTVYEFVLQALTNCNAVKNKVISQAKNFFFSVQLHTVLEIYQQIKGFSIWSRKYSQRQDLPIAIRQYL